MMDNNNKLLLVGIIDLVYTLESELDDAYNSLPEYRANVDSQSSIDYARSTLYDLKEKLEKLKYKSLDD